MRFLKFGLFLLVAYLSTAAGSAQVVVGQTHPIHSNVLNEEKSYQVQLPESYAWAKDRRYPVLYLLDAKANFLHTAVSVGFLSAQGEIPEMIVVGLDSSRRVRDFTPTDWPEAWVGGGGAEKFKQFLSAELISTIEKTYRTDGFRVLSGHSASGLFALYCLVSEPSLFHAYIALSPSLDWDHNWAQRSLKKSFESTRSLKAFLYVAHSDDSGRPLEEYEELIQTLKTKSPQGFRWFGQAFPEETHTGVGLLGEIDALRHLYFGYRFHPDMMSKGFSYAEQHFKDVSKTVGWPFPIPENVINNFAYDALSEGKTHEAIGLFKRNVEANPNSANAWDGLADCYAKMGQWKDAVEASEKSVTLATIFANPNLPDFIKQAKKMNDHLKQEIVPLK